MPGINDTPQQNAFLFQRWLWMKKHLAETLSHEFPALFMWWNEVQQEEEVAIAVQGSRVVPAPSRTCAGMAHVVGVQEWKVIDYVGAFEDCLQRLMLDRSVLRDLYLAYEQEHVRSADAVVPTGHDLSSLGPVTGTVVAVQGGQVTRDRVEHIDLNDWDQPYFDEIFSPLKVAQPEEEEDVRQPTTQE